MPQETPNFTDAAVFKHSASGFTPASGSAAVYVKSDNKLYIKDSSGTEAAAGGVTGAASSASDVLGVSGSDITGVDANADRIVFWDDSASALKYLEVSTGLSLSGTTLTATATGTIGGSTGSTDNSLLRSDGTGGSTAQASALVVDDATTSTQANVALRNNHSETNSSLVLSPKGTGALLARKPDGTATGGNARGANAVDLQTFFDGFSSAGNVAGGARSVICGGGRNSAGGTEAVVCGGTGNNASNTKSAILCGNSNTSSSSFSTVINGDSSQATADAALAHGRTAIASGASAVAIGNTATASAANSLAFGSNVLANRLGMQAYAYGQFASQGDAQRARFVLRCKTTTNSAVEMALDGSATYLTIPSGKVIFCNIKVVGVKSDGSVVATYERQYAAKNVAGTSSEVYAAVTIGTDNAASTSLEVATVDAGDYIRIRPTGIASETWRWVASVDAVEVAYGT